MRSEFTVATFNLLNLVDANTPYYDKEGLTLAEYNKKCDWLADQFDRLDADILAVQEVWSLAALQDVCRRSVTMRNASLITAPGAVPGNQLPKVGLISKLPIVGDVESIDAIPAFISLALPGPGDPALPVEIREHRQFSRPVLKVRVNLNRADEAAYPLVVHVVHLKSKRPDRYEVETAEGAVGEDLDDPLLNALASFRSLVIRGIEATALRSIILDSVRHTDTPLMVLGDFNDNADAVTTEIIKGRAASQDKGARDHLLYDAADLEFRHKLRRDVGYTHIHQGDPDTLDHILVSEQFNPQSLRAGFRLSRLDYFNDHLCERNSWGSDHGAIRAQFSIIDRSSSN